MDQLGGPVRVVPRRGTHALQASAVTATMLAVSLTGGWPFAGGEAVERLVVSAEAPTPELEAFARSADGVRPPLGAPAGPPVSTTAATSVVVVPGPGADPVGTERAMAAYRAAAGVVAEQDPGCRLPWALLAGIGLVESGHGTVHGSTLDAGGKATPPILGPALNGNGFALITDTDGGVLDGDLALDRAVGPMQFIPGTWVRWGSDGDGDLIADPQDVDDAALAAGRYLCASGGRLDAPDGLVRAVFSYNHSYDYVRLAPTVTARYLGVDPAALGVDRLPAPAPEPTPTPEPPPGELAPAEATPEPGPTEPPAEPGPTEPPAEPGPTDPPVEPAPTGPPTEPGPTEPVPTGPPTEPSPTEPAPCPTPGTIPVQDPGCVPLAPVAAVGPEPATL